MRKNLFLILALAFACFATANAQWMRVLNAEDGLPGTQDASVGVETVKTGLITPDAPVSGVRLTILQTRNMEKPDGWPTTSFSEIMFVDANGQTISYEATTNAPQVESKGIAALNDGLYDSYMHTCWNAANTPGDYHYIEFAFEAPVESFRLFWGNRKDKTTNAPTVAVLTEAGVSGVIEEENIPEVDLGVYAIGSQLASFDEIVAAEYITLQTTNITEWTKDNASSYGNYENWGPRYMEAPNSYSVPGEEPTAKNAAQLIDNGDGTYKLYFCNAGGYMAKNVIDHTNSQAWLWLTSNADEAAALTLNMTDDGLVEFSFPTNLNDDDKTPVTGWVIADPRWWADQNYALKVVTQAAKDDVQSSTPQYPEGSYRLPGSFGFKVFSAEYTEPAYLATAPLNEAIFDAYLAIARLDGKLSIEDDYGTTYYDDLVAAVAAAQEKMAAGLSQVEAAALVDEINTNRLWYGYTAVQAAIANTNALYDELADITYNENWEPEYGYDENGMPVHGPNTQFCTEANLVTGKYTQESWDNTVQAVLNNLNDVYVYKADNGQLEISDFVPMLNEVDAVSTALEQFYEGKVEMTPFPVVFNAEDGLPGSEVGGRVVWQSPVVRPGTEALEGFRITFVKTANPTGAAAVNSGKYPPVAIMEMDVRDAAGAKIAITPEMLSTNAQELNEGPISGLVDGTFNANGDVIEFGTFYHSPWSSNYTWDPEGLIYFDVQLPEGISAFTVKFFSRDGGAKSFYPSEICIGNYGEEYDPIATSPNPYDVTGRSQVTSVDNIYDWSLYAIQGIIKTNPNEQTLPAENRIEPNWYAGRTPFHATALREGCAYFFIKNSDGTFSILNLKESKFWSPSGALVSTSAEAGKFHIVASENEDFAGQHTFVIYSDIENPEPTTASCEYINEETGEEIIIDEVEVTCPYNVLMDWGPGYGTASRACIDFQPGVVPSNYGEQADIAETITPALEATSSLGDYLHFNKTSGEGEWKIYELEMNNPFFFWLTSLVDVVAAAGLEPGENPGQLIDAGTFAEDLEAANQVIEATNYMEAEATAKKLAATVESLTSGEVARRPIENGGTYMLESALSGFGRRYAMYVNLSEEGNTLHWGTKPASFEDANGMRFVFEMKTPSNIEELILEEYITEEQRESVFTIMNVNTGQYLAGVELVDDADQASVYLFGRGSSDIFDIKDIAVTEGHSELHNNGHGGGSGTGGTIVFWNGDPTDSSASAWRLIKTAVPTSIDNLVVEGSEVESVKYYTVGGAEVPAPVKGINIISIRYTNGVEKTEKVVVE